jgi:hypothetical protein
MGNNRTRLIQVTRNKSLPLILDVPPPLFLAVQYKHYEVVELLIKYKANVNYVYSNRLLRTVLHVAACHSKPKIVKLLLEKVENKQICGADGWGNSPLHYARDAEIAKILIDAGANIEQENLQGYVYRMNFR